MDTFISFWKSTDFTGWNESDIREDFIAPLLQYLGYSKRTVNKVFREQSFKLNSCFHRIGRKRVDIDYIPTIALKKFWIIEAKPPNPVKTEAGDFLQAHLYAIHPEVQVPYIVLINGYEIIIYDTKEASAWENTLFISKQSDCETTFEKIQLFLSAENILKSIRGHILDTLKESFDVEIDLRVHKSFSIELNKLLRDSQKKVEENAREFSRKAWSKKIDDEKSSIRNANFSHLLIMMDIPTEARPIYANEILLRFSKSTSTDQQKMADKLAMTYRGRPHQIFRVNCTDIFIKLHINNYQIEKSSYVNSVIGCLEELVTKNMNYWGAHSLSSGLIFLENTCLRYSYKFCRKLLVKELHEIVLQNNKILPIEDILTRRPTVAAELIPTVAIMSENLWRLFCSESNTEVIWESIWQLEKLEKVIDQIKTPSYPDNDGDLLFFNSYGKGYDMLRSGTWDVLQRSKAELSKKELPECITKVLEMSREDILASYPTPKKPPINWKPSDNFFQIFKNKTNNEN